MAGGDTDETARRGVTLCGYQIPTALGWVFREQTTSDYGVDAHVETRADGRPTGRLLGVQIKAGSSYFRTRTDGGWTFRPTTEHVRYWLGHSLPMFILLVDLEADTVYWQALDETTIKPTRQGGWSVHVPADNTLAAARAPWENAANELTRHAVERYRDNLDVLPGPTRETLARIAATAPEGAAFLAAHFAKGRTQPGLVVQTLLQTESSWLADLGADGWIAVANYADSHGVSEDAAAAYLRAAELSTDRSGRLTAAAGMCLLVIDRERARSLFSAVSASSDASLLGEIGHLLCDYPAESSRPLVVSAQLEARLAAAPDDATILSFRASHAARLRNHDVAVQLWERVLKVAPANPTAMTQLAEELGRRAQTKLRRSNDASRAAEIAEAAVEQLRRWGGKTDDALRVLLQVLTSGGNWAAALRHATPTPNGNARSEEAERPGVLVVAVAAATVLGQAALAERLIDQLPEGVDRAYADAAIRTNDDTPPDERRHIWEPLLDELDDDRPEQLVDATMQLALLGLDRSVRLDGLVDRGAITAELREVVRAIAHAAADPDTGLPALRTLADTDNVAAHHLIRILEIAGHIDEALTACTTAAARFRDPRFTIIQTEILYENDRFDEAKAVAMLALSNPGLSDAELRHAHRLVARIAALTDDWPEVERQLEQELANGPGEPSVSAVWQLIHAQVQQRELARALSTIRQYQPEIRDIGDAELWLIAIQGQPVDAEIASQMLALALRFESDARLSGALLTAVVTSTRDEGEDGAAGPLDSRPVVGDELRRQAFAALAQHVERHGDDSPIRFIEAPTPEAMVAKLVEEMRRDDQPINELVDHIRAGRIPLGMLATAAGRGYAFAVVQRVLGMYIASTVGDGEIEIEIDAAANSVGCDVVVDASSLLVSSLLNEFATIRGTHPRLLIPLISRDDIRRARTEMNGMTSSSGTLGWSSAAGGLVMHEPDIAHQLASLQRLALLEAAMEHTEAARVTALPAFPESDLLRDGAWLAPVQLAKDRGAALWSDDVALRNLARTIGVPAFSTTSVQELRAVHALDALATDDTADTEQILNARQLEANTALEHRVVDLPVTVDDLIDTATAEQFPADLAHATIGRPAWWTWSTNPWQDLHALLSVVAARTDSGTTLQWRVAAMVGAADLNQGDAVRVAVWLAAVTLVPTSDEPAAGLGAQMLAAADAIASRVGGASPRAHLPQAAAELHALGFLDNPQQIVAEMLSGDEATAVVA